MRPTPGNPSKAVRRAIIAGVAVSLCWLAACSGSSSSSGSSESATSSAAPVDVKVGGSVVSTAGSLNEMNVVVPEPITASLSELGGAGSGVEWVAVAGDGITTTEPVAVTSDATAAVTDLTGQINEAQAKSPGRSALAGLEAIKSPAGSPVWVFSPMLDTLAPLDFNQLAFDESPPNVVDAVKAAGNLPDLQGREVTYVVTPPAGAQEKLTDLQIGYQHAIWDGIATAAGASKVTFMDGTGTTPGTGTVPPIAIPDPNDKINSEQQGQTRTCTLPSPALFLPNEPTLIDKAATLAALKDCLGTLDPTTKITVEGYTAAVAGEDQAAAVDLSTRRATEVAALLRELNVPAENISNVVGYGSAKPLVEPASDPANRAVVVTFTSAS